MNQPPRRRHLWAGLSWAALLLAGWAAAVNFTGPGGAVSPGGDNAGGHDAGASESLRLAGAVSEVSLSTAVSETLVLRAGLLEIRSYPGKVNTLAALSLTSTTLNLSWTAPGYDGDAGQLAVGSVFRIQRETNPAAVFAFDAAQVQLSTSGVGPGEIQDALLSGLAPNTTHFLRLWTQDADGNLSPLSNGATAATLAVPASGPAFKGVFLTSVSVTWTPLPVGPPLSDTAEGYRLEASTAANFSGALYSSSTPNVALSTLTVLGLEVDSTYYFRVGSLTHDGRGNFIAASSTKTLLGAVPPGNVRIQALSSSTVSMAWNPVNSDLGYALEASTAANFSGTLRSSSTAGGSQALLTVAGLDANTTYYLRVAALWTAETKYAATLSTSTWAAAPVGAFFKDIFITSAALTWTALPSSPPEASSMTSEGYVVEASSTDFGVLSLGGAVLSSMTTNAALSTLTVSGLEVNTTYYFRLASLSWSSGRNLVVLSATATLASPPGPGAPLLSAVFMSSVSANWSAGSPPNRPQTRYLLQASSMAFAPNEVIVASDTANISDIVTGLLPDTTYELRVEVLNYNSVPARLALGSTATFAEPPGASFLAAVFQTSAAVNWTPVAAQGYRLEASSTNFGAALPGGLTLASATANGAVPGLIVPGLERNTTYYFRVASLNWNSAANFAVLGASSTLAAPVAGAQIYGVFETSATLNWAALAASPQAATSEGYELQASSTNFGALLPGGTVLSSSTPNAALSTLTVSGLAADTTYYFRVGALNWAGAPSLVVVGSTSTLSSPVTPAFVSIQVTSAVVSWTPVPSQGYELQASVNANFSPLFFSSTSAGGASSLDVQGLSADTTYFWRVGSINHNSARNFTALDSTSTLTLAPTSPFFPASGVFFTSVTVQWGAVTSQGYLLSASTAADLSGDLISSATLNGLSTRLIDLGLDSGTTYYFRVGAYNHNSVPNYSAVLATQTLNSPKTWTGATNNLWNTATNWSPSGVPGKNDSVSIVITANIDAAGTAISFSSLTIGSPAGVAVALTLSTTVANSGDVIIYKNAGLTLATTNLILLNGDLIMVSGSSLSHRNNATAQNYAVNLNVSGLFDLRSGATVAVSGVGYKGGAANVTGSGPQGGGGTSINNTGGGGGGHGGAGSAGTGGSGGAANDSPTSPAILGSGGGGGRIGVGTGQAGGAGGGLAVIAAQTMNILGRIDADGKDGGLGAGSGGGGAGGGVRLTAQVFSGTGTIAARGGAGGDSLGGGGGGGRVSIDIAASGSACDLSYDVSGGTGTSASGAAGTVSSTATIIAPAAFTGLNATTSTIHWTWALSNGAGSYQIFSSTGGDGQSPVLSAQTSFYTATDLAANTTHAFFVRALSCGQNTDSASFSLSTLPKTPLALPQAFLAVNASSITIAWSSLPAAPQEDSSEGYRLDASTAPNFTGTVSSSVTANVLLSTLTVSALLPNTTYYFRVAALNWAGALSSFTTLGATSTLSGPLAQAQIFAVFGTSMTLNWTPLPSSPPDASSKTAEGYRVELSTAANFTGVIFSSFTPAVTLATLTVSNLNSETQYFARAGAANWNSVFNFTGVGFAVAKDTTPPSAVAGLSAQSAASSTTLSLAWTAPGDNGAIGCVVSGRYRLDYSSDVLHVFSTSTFTVDFSTSFCPGEAQSRTLNALLPNTTYFVRIYALDEDFNTASLSNGATAPTLAPPVAVLPQTFLGVFQSSVTLAWAALPSSPPDASSKTAEGYRVEASSTNFGALLPGGAVLSSFTANVAASTLTVLGLTADVTYYFRVAALNWSSQPNYAALGSTLTVTTPGAAPLNPAIYRVYGGSITLSWLAVNSDGGYVAQASTAANFSGELFSSATANGNAVFLTPGSLDTNTTYYLRVGALWGQTTSYASVLSTSSLAVPVSNTAFAGLFFTSAAVNWTALPASPPDASSKTAEGYVLEASTASNFTGAVFSSATRNAAVETLVVLGLSVNTTYYFRVGSLNWNDATNYASVGSSATLASPPGLAGTIFTGVFLSSMSAQWTAGSPTNPAGTRYRLQGSSTAFAPGTLVVSSTTGNLFAALSALLPNTTYELRVAALNFNNAPSMTALASTSTLSSAPLVLPETFLGVFETSATVAWAKHPAAPPDASSKTAEGYLLQASSTNFAALLPGGLVHSSATTAIAASTLTLTGLERNTTYYFRVASLNW
ncbi:MAG: fibronectin type III domain-containing protein, partial [Elusimicrobiota bacterium]